MPLFETAAVVLLGSLALIVAPRGDITLVGRSVDCFNFIKRLSHEVPKQKQKQKQKTKIETLRSAIGDGNNSNQQATQA